MIFIAKFIQFYGSGEDCGVGAAALGVPGGVEVPAGGGDLLFKGFDFNRFGQLHLGFFSQASCLLDKFCF